MTALMAPSRGGSFDGIVFFVYDREAVKKEEDPPENAIIYFYPPSASIEERVSICGQLIGMSHFIHGFIGMQPALFKLRTEKMATKTSGKYTLALGAGLMEPDSLLIRQLETLHSIFTFYHGSLDRMRMMCNNQRSFLLLMNVIWDCYLPFVRHYGDFLPGVFDPLPFLDLPKDVAATCFTKASYILQACQRRHHVLGGCILYNNSILCTQLEPGITERLLLLKPNQANHPARPVKTEYVLPFGVRILNAFVTLSEYLNLHEALAQSPYRKSGSPEGTVTFPDLYTVHQPSTFQRNFDTSQDSGRFDRHPWPVSKTDSTDGSNKDAAMNIASKSNRSSRNSRIGFNSSNTHHRGVNSLEIPSLASTSIAHSETPHVQKRFQHEVTHTNSNSQTCEAKEAATESAEVGQLNDQDRNVSTVEENENEGGLVEQREKEPYVSQYDEEEDGKISYANEESGAAQGDLTLNRASESSSDYCLSMDEIDVTGLTVVQHCCPSVQGKTPSDEAETNSRSGSSCHASRRVDEKEARFSKRKDVKFCLDDDVMACLLVIEDLVTRVVEAADSTSSNGTAVSSQSQCTDVAWQDPVPCRCIKPAGGNGDDIGAAINVPTDSITSNGNRRLSDDNSNLRYFPVNKATSSANNSYGMDFVSTERRNSAGKSSGIVLSSDGEVISNNSSSDVDFLSTKERKSAGNISSLHISANEGTNSSGNSSSLDILSNEETNLVENSRDMDFSSNEEEFPRANLLKTPIVCDSFLSCNLNSDVDKHLEKSFSNSGNFSDAGFSNESENSSSTLVSSGTITMESVAVKSSISIDPVPVIRVEAESDSLPIDTVTAVDTAQEETEDGSPNLEPLLDSGHAYCASTSADEEVPFYDEEDGTNEVEGLTHVNLYVQAHSRVALILLAEELLYDDFNCVKALWETSLNELGELEFLIKQSLDNPQKPAQTDKHSFMVYDTFERTMKGSLGEPVIQLDHLFCETSKMMNEQLENCPALRDITLGSRSSTIYGKRNLGRGTYFHVKNPYKTIPGVPSNREPAWKLERKAFKVLRYEHGVNMF